MKYCLISIQIRNSIDQIGYVKFVVLNVYQIILYYALKYFKMTYITVVIVNVYIKSVM